MNIELGSIGILGKVPWREEYLNARAHGEPFASFDAWVTQNIEWAAARAGADWPAAYRSGGVNAFVFRSSGSTGATLTGVIAPSSDAAGRDYPLVVAAPAATRACAGAPELIPLFLEPYWQVASDLLLHATAGEAVVERLESTYAPPVESSSEVAESYSEWMRSLPLVELWTLLYGEGGCEVAPRALQLVVEAVRPLVGVEHPKTALTLRLPLGESGGAAVCFWIHLICRVARWKSTIPSFFWSHDGVTGSMLLHLGEPPRSTLAELWAPKPERDEFCDLAPPIPNERLRDIPELAADAARVVRSGDASVLELLDVFGSSRR
jgi:type VI secretion system ImpM family protein